MKKIKILHIIKSLGRGGAEMLLPETLRVHDTTRFEFHYIYFLPWKDQMVSAIREAGGIVTCIPATNNIQLLMRANRVADYAKKNNIDVIHAHLPWAGVVARIVGKLTKIPILYTEHNKQERYHLLTRWINLFTMNWLTRLIAVSSDVASSVRKYKQGLRPPLLTVLNGVNLERFAPGYPGADVVKSTLGIPAGAPVIGTVAVFRFQKRLDVWMEVAMAISKKHPDVHFIIVGDGPLKQQLESRRKELGAENKIHLAGLQTEVRPYLSAMDLYMMTSIFEGLPIALLEAMSSECAVITTNAGGIGELVRHDVDGLVCEVENPDQLTAFADSLLTDQVRLEMLQQNARKRIEESFSLEFMVSQLEAIYDEARR